MPAPSSRISVVVVWLLRGRFTSHCQQDCISTRANGTITGTPGANQTATTYTIYANNSGGDASTTVSITVNEPIAVLSPASQSHTFTKDAVAGAILQNLSGGGVVATWAIHPAACWDALQHRERDDHRDAHWESDRHHLHDPRQQLRRRCLNHGLHHGE